jgi:hypothetical protein
MIILQLLAVYSGVFLFLGFEMLFFEASFALIANLEILQMSFQKAIAERDLYAIKRSIENHKKTEQCFMKLKDILTPFIFNKFLLSGIIICLSTFQAVVAGLNVNDFFYYIGCTILASLNLLVFSYIGSSMSDEVIVRLPNASE